MQGHICFFEKLDSLIHIRFWQLKGVFIILKKNDTSRMEKIGLVLTQHGLSYKHD